jgi:hypothetical protein
MSREFKELTLDGNDYPRWEIDLKISLTLRGMYEAIIPPAQRQQELLATYKYNALYIIRHHILADLKSKYVLEEESSTL